MAESLNPYSKNSLRPILQCIMSAAAVALITTNIASIKSVQTVALLVLPAITRLVPSVIRISTETGNPIASEIVLMAQWAFIPVYIFMWFFYFTPWSPKMRLAVRPTAKSLTPIKRWIVYPIALLVLGMWILGTFGLIDFPTLYNGKFAFPVANAVPYLLVIYSSSIAFAVYAWLSPITEASVLWMFAVLALNAKIYLMPPTE